MEQTYFSGDNKIGVFDSGSGGLSILHSILEVLPFESYVYLGDHANMPYGEKSTEFIRQRTASNITYLLSHEVKLIVIACNTATVAGIDWYREQFPNIPIVGVVPVIKTAAARSKTNHFVVLSTSYTAKSPYQEELIAKYADSHTVTSLGSSVLVPLIEQGIVDGPPVESELKKLLSEVNPRTYDIIVLGCTHYPFLKSALRAMIGTDVEVLDSGGAVARQVQRILLDRNALSKKRNGTVEYFTTGNAQKVQTLFGSLLKHEVTVTHIMV